ncbi:MAG TPA: glycosyltransferase [Candidatus Eisenbacteria bacterium]
MGSAPQSATVIVTVRNESGSIDALLDSLLRGARAPDEIVVADGGSTDGTVERLRARAASEPRLRVLETPGNRSVGRNAAIRAARHEIIACTDAGVEVEPSWLEEILKPFTGGGDGPEGAADVVAGFYRPVASTPFERAAGVVSAPRLEEVNLDRFLPSTRSIAFRREAWSRAGGFDEMLAHNEDTPFALALKNAGCRFAFAPAAIVGWRPRGDLRSFYRQHRRFGLGDGESRVQAWFYATIAVKYGMAAVLAILGFVFPAAWLLLAAGAALFVLQQAGRGFGRIGFLEALVGVPLLKIVYDVAYLNGYVRGRLSPAAVSG